VLTRAWGLRGDLVAIPFSDHEERFQNLDRVYLFGDGRKYEVESVREVSGSLVFKFRGIDSMSDAELWRGAEVRIPREERLALEPGEFFLSDLAGYTAPVEVEVFNEALWAHHSFDHVRNKQRRNDFGGTFGGPIFKNHTFFFGSVFFLRSQQGQTFLANVETPEFASYVAQNFPNSVATQFFQRGAPGAVPTSNFRTVGDIESDPGLGSPYPSAGFPTDLVAEGQASTSGGLGGVVHRRRGHQHRGHPLCRTNVARYCRQQGGRHRNPELHARRELHPLAVSQRGRRRATWCLPAGDIRPATEHRWR